MLRCIRDLKPRWIVAENVFGITSLEESESIIDLEINPESQSDEEDNGIIKSTDYFGRVLPKIIQEIEKEGYSVPKSTDGTPIIPVAPACAVGADHRRYRVFIIANANSNRRGRIRDDRRKRIQGNKTRFKDKPSNQSENTVDNPDNDGERCFRASISVQSGEPRKEMYDSGRIDSDMHSPGSQRYREPGERTDECTSWAGAWERPWLEIATRFCGVDDGLPGRVDRLRCLGNAVVPAQAFPILEAIANYEKGRYP